MALSNRPAYAQAFRSYTARTTAAKTTHGDTTNGTLLFTAGPNGSLCRKMTAAPAAACGVTGLTAYKSSDGIVASPCASSALGLAYSVDGTKAVPVVDLGPSSATPMQFGPNEQCWVGQGVALTQGFGWAAEVSDL